LIHWIEVKRLRTYVLIKNRQNRHNHPGRVRAQIADGTARVFLSLFCVLLCAALMTGGYFYAQLTHDLPSIEQLPVMLNRENGELLQPSRLYDRTGTEVLYTLDNPGIVRKFLTVNPDQPDHFSLQLVRLAVARLEPGFWTSNGVDMEALTDPQPHTIAERLARGLLIADEEDSTRSALRMRLLASQLVSKYGRTQVLEWYLNSAYFGHLSYSAESAARLYLNKSASDLDLAEAALLVSLIESPALNPLDAPAAAAESQKTLLKDLFAGGTITKEEFNASSAEKLVFASAPTETPSASTAFIDLAKAQLIDLVGTTRVERGGLKVITTLDLDLQTQLVCASRSQLIQVESALSGVAPDLMECPAANYLPTQSYSAGNMDLAAAGLIMDPATGQILAYSTPVDINGRNVDAVFQPGSLLSPFVAMTAFARGDSPASLAWDVPMSLPTGLENEKNPDGSFHGPVNYRIALANDYVAPLAEIFQQYDAQTVWSIASASGLSVVEDGAASPSILFSGGETSLDEIAQAYAILAAEGVQNGVFNPATEKIENVAILKVQTSNGQTLVDNTLPRQQSIISTSLAYLVNNILSDETSRWTNLGHPNALEIGRPVAVKIGQVSSHDQTWTVGYTPYRLVLSWVGNGAANSEPAAVDYRMSAGLWHALIQYASLDLPADDWEKPLDVTEMQVCSPSGMLPTNNCPNITTDVFIFGNEPTQADTLYQKAKVNRETGLLATVYTPQDMIEENVYLNVPPAIRTWAINAGFSVLPQGYDAIPMTAANPLVQITSPVIFSSVKGKVTITGTANIDSFASYTIQVGRGINPDTWEQIGDTQTKPVVDGTLAIWDTSGLDGLYAIRLTVLSKNNEISTAVLQVTVDNVAPVIQISYPAADGQVTAINGAITLTASISDTVGVARVEWWLDGKLISEQTDAPYIVLWNSTPGKHKLQVKAWDKARNEADSETIQFEVVK
jgi:membrane peptidoglycan carboxypeptidase